MNHDAYVFAAYAISALVIALTVGWVVFDYRGRKADLATLEAAGVRRRSEEA
ncbi:MAG: heme exporter protein CcmD [Phyllobacteriaceae bacterium]|nr:heme exporter protein CcmD [Phyllobacteriaceae bacterium]